MSAHDEQTPGVVGPCSDTLLDEIERQLDQGLYLQVDPHIEALVADGSPRAIALAVRALRFLGAERRGDALALQVWRRHRHNATALVGKLRTRLYRRGPFVGWREFEHQPLPDDASPGERADYLSLRSFMLSGLRDFAVAAQLNAEARQLAPRDPWLLVEQSYMLERADRYEDALRACDDALQLSPRYRAAVQQRIELLLSMRRRDEAIALLREAMTHSECMAYAMRLFDLRFEDGALDECETLLAEVVRQQPRADRWCRSAHAARRADLAMARGQMELAREEAGRVEGSIFYSNVAERIAEGQTPHRVVLPVAFVRQHWNTCAPATLAALAEYWQQPADHLEIAEEICYDGTSDSSERNWASENGFITHEFRVNWDTATTLLDAGIPFTLVTTYTAGGHLQAVIGYDRLRGSLLIRDPFQATHVEFDAAALFAQHASSGPRGMVMVPHAQAERLAGITLPDAGLWDSYHVINRALGKHDRDAALAALQTLQASDADHRLTLQGQRTLTIYDGDEAGTLACTERLLALYPDDTNLQLSKAASLGVIGGRAAHLEWLGQLASRPWPDPLILARYADRLSEDSRRLPQAFDIVHRALRRASINGRLWLQWAILTWQSGRYRESLPLYRFASTLYETDEDAASAYARGCRILGDSQSGIALLRERVTALGGKSAAPMITLFEQLEALERTEEAFGVLDDALQRHPEDSHLAVYCAEAHLRYGHLDRAEALLQGIHTPLRRASWLRAQSLLCDARNDFEGALQHAREASALEPLQLRHHRSVAIQLARREGREAAIAWLEAASNQHPRNYALARLAHEWLPADPPRVEAHLRRLQAAHPGDVWTLRELALELGRQKRYDEARKLADSALLRAPEDPVTLGILAWLLQRTDGYAASAPILRRAITRDVDYDYALRTLIQEAPDTATANEAIAFVRSELVRQVTTGDSLMTFQECAQTRLAPDELLAVMREAHAARSDLWHAWVALGMQLTDMGLAEESLPIFEEALQRFTMLPRLFVEYAQSLKLVGRRDEARKQLEAALSINPTWNRAIRLYSDTVSEESPEWNAHWERCEQLIRQCVTREPDNADMHGLLSWLLEQKKDYGGSLDAARASLQRDPQPRWVWACAWRSCEKRETLADFDTLLDEVEQARPGDPWAWVARAQNGGDHAKALAAAEHALTLEPWNIAAWDARLDRLARLERYREIETLVNGLQWPDGATPNTLVLAGLRARRLHNKVGALKGLRQHLASAPNSYASWQLLADWSDEDGELDNYIAATRELVRIAPNHAPSHGYLGHALLRKDRHAEALPEFEKAVALQPDYGFAVWFLHDAAMTCKLPELSVQAIEALWPHQRSAAFASRATQAAARAKNQEAALRWLERTLQMAGYETEPAEKALISVRGAGWRDQAKDAVQRCIQQGECAWFAVKEFVSDHLHLRYVNGAIKDLDDLIRNEQGTVLKMALLDHAGDKRDKRLLEAMLERYEALLRKHDNTWGQVSFAMHCLSEYKRASHWMHDWRERPDAPHWALGNVALSYASTGNFEPLGEVANRVLTLAPQNEDARLWHLVDLAAREQHEELASALGKLDEWKPEQWMKPILDVLKAYNQSVQTKKLMGAVSAFTAATPHKAGLDSIRHVCRRLGRQLARQRAPAWLRPFVWWMLDCW
ncbi:MAG: C39 family peptidase [Rhodocyclaceae bacterium]